MFLSQEQAGFLFKRIFSLFLCLLKTILNNQVLTLNSDNEK